VLLSLIVIDVSALLLLFLLLFYMSGAGGRRKESGDSMLAMVIQRGFARWLDTVF
jgi:hypothetical protein